MGIAVLGSDLDKIHFCLLTCLRSGSLGNQRLWFRVDSAMEIGRQEVYLGKFSGSTSVGGGREAGLGEGEAEL